MLTLWSVIFRKTVPSMDRRLTVALAPIVF
jgi:hypothetical protein